MAKPDPQNFDDTIGSGDQDGDQKNVQQFIQGTSAQTGLKQLAKDGLAALKLKEGDPGANQPGWYRPIRIEYTGPHAQPRWTLSLRRLFGLSPRRYKLSIKKFKTPTGNLDPNVTVLVGTIKTELLTRMGKTSHPKHWRSIIRIAKSRDDDPNKIDEAQCGCCCGAA
jgi:hypothetical protein